MSYNSYILGRQAEIEIAGLLNGKLYGDVHHGDFDILYKGKVRIEVKSATFRNNHWAFVFNSSGQRIKKKSDIVICAGYNEERTKIESILLIPSKKLPKWQTSISFRLVRENKVRKTWDKYVVKEKDLHKKVKEFYNKNHLKLGNYKVKWKTCKRCHYSWTPRKKEVLTCPKCRSPYWHRKKEVQNDSKTN